MSRNVAIAIAAALLITAVWIYLDTKRVSPAGVLPLVAAIDRSVDVLQSTREEEVAGALLQERGDQLERARRMVLLRRGGRQDAKQALIAVLDSTIVDLSRIQVGLTTRRSANLALIAQLRSQVTSLREIIAQSGQTPVSGAWLADLVRVIAWPLFAGILLVYVLTSTTAPERIAVLLRPFASIKLFGAELTLSDEVKHRAEEAFQAYRTQVKSSFDLQVQRYGIAEKLRDLVDQAVIPFLTDTLHKDPRQSSLRCTIHVPDLLFADHLYQLLDYYPDYPGAEKHGRVWPIYFGLIGKVWRAGASEVDGKVPTDDPDRLIAEWGMTRDEANRAGKGRQSFLGVLLKDSRRNQLGIVYMDAQSEWTFSTDAGDRRICDIVLRACDERGLTDSLATMTNNLRDQSLLIKLHG